MATASEAVVHSPTQTLRKGCRVELTGLSSEDLNGQRGTISGSYIAARERWPVVVDGTGRKLSCKPSNLKGLASGSCKPSNGDDTPEPPRPSTATAMPGAGDQTQGQVAVQATASATHQHQHQQPRTTHVSAAMQTAIMNVLTPAYVAPTLRQIAHVFGDGYDVTQQPYRPPQVARTPDLIRACCMD